MQSLGYLMQFELHLNLSQSIQPTVRLRENGKIKMDISRPPLRLSVN